MAMTNALRLPATWRDTGLAGATTALGIAVVAVLVAQFDAGPALAVLVGAAAVVTAWMYPGVATPLAVCLLYVNLPSAIGGAIPAAQMFAASFALPLAIPLLHTLLKGARLIFDRTFVLMLTYFAVLLVSAMGAVDWRVAALQIGEYLAEGLVLYWLLVQAIRTRVMLRRVMWTLALAGAFLASLTIYQQVSGDYGTQFGGLAKRQLRHDIAQAAIAGETGDQFTPTLNRSTYIRTSHRAGGPVGDPNRFAQLLLIGLPWTVLLAYRSRSLIARNAAGLSAVLMFAGIGLTYSRGSFVTIGLMLVGLVLYRLVRPSRLLAGAAIATLIVLALAPNYFQRMGTIFDATAIVDDNSTANPDGAIRGRATEVLAALWVFAEHPILGVGPGQYTPFYSQKYQQQPEIQFRELSRPREAHNLYASIAAETGVIGLTAFLAIFVSLISRLIRARRYWVSRDPELAALAIACLFSLAAYLGTGVFLHLAYERYQTLLLALAGATLYVMRVELTKRQAETGGLR
jgi:putative inorganic carbon (HCO3(-)) transporter